MKHRIPLRRAVLLRGESDQGAFQRTFVISRVLSTSGASAVCYAAGYSGGRTGVLKEFYPQEIASLTRDAQGQLLLRDAPDYERASFAVLRDAYTAPYRRMLTACQQEPALATFIPPFEIYHGCSDDPDSADTVYIWSPEPTLETFDTVCAEIRSHPDVQPEYSLLRVLYSVESLVKCVCAMHRAGLLHRDIKPSNFGFLRRGNELLTQTVSLFDVDTVCSVYDVPTDSACGSVGYLEPESLRKPANNLTDIFAIGAVLFHAVVLSEECYDPALYGRIKELVDSSALINASETNAHPRLRMLLTDILRKSLCPRAQRYQSCEALLADLQRALFYVIPAQLADRGQSGEQWVLSDAADLNLLDRHQDANSTLALQYHLFTEPLYADSPADRETLDILVIGCGKYGQRFLDLALQIGQMPGKRLNITVISDTPDDRTLYLSERPALPDFFEIDGVTRAERFGAVRFLVHTFSPEQAAADRAWLDQALAVHDCRPVYAFIAAGRDETTLAVAHALALPCRTSVALEGELPKKRVLRGLTPVCIHAPLSDRPFYAALERMALNVHLVWKKDLNVRFRDVRREFRQKYNHDSCVSFVLAMKYMLHALGMELDVLHTEQAAEQYAAWLRSDAEKRSEMICLEHRRWIAEKLCLGFRPLTDLDSCAGGVMKDERRKLHVCLVPSTPAAGLSEWRTPSGQPDPEKWDHPTAEMLAALDPLDRMSVQLHMVLLRHGEAAAQSGLPDGEAAEAIAGYTESDPVCAAHFREWMACMRDICGGNSMQCRRFEGLYSALTGAVKASRQLHDTDTVLSLAALLREQFFPIFASKQYRDYKRDDEALVDAIPFILTYTERLRLATPLITGADAFANVAAAAVLNPERVLYPVYCADETALDAVTDALRSAAEWMNRRALRAQLVLLLGIPALAEPDAYLQRLRGVCGNRMHQLRVFPAKDTDDFADRLHAYLRRCSPLLTALNGSPLSKRLEKSTLPCFRFDSANMRFDAVSGCTALAYLHARPYLTVTELPHIGLSPAGSRPELYGEYRMLWAEFCKDPAAWRALCERIRQYTEQHGTVAEFSRRTRANLKTVQFRLPAQCRTAVRRLLRALHDAELIGDSAVSSQSADSVTVTVQDRFGNADALDALTGRIGLLMQEPLLRFVCAEHTVRVLYDDPAVHALSCAGLPAQSMHLLGLLAEKGCLRCLQTDAAAETVSFSFASMQVRELLTDPERLAAVSVYHRAKESGQFDDIRSSSELTLRGVPLRGADCVMTKGFTSVFVRCAVGREPDDAEIRALQALAAQYGINGRAVMITDPEHAELFS